jgi:serine/threonine protein kinase/tetratricopeptide (TPR) repeat protein
MPLDPQRAKSVFLAALERAADERGAFLDDACAGDAELRQRVDRLLQAHDRPDSVPQALAAPIPTVDPAPHEGEDSASGLVAAVERPGAVIGPYKLMEQIGEGGMGLVFVAEQQQPVRRKVALKVIKPGMDSRAVVGRFEAERQALALMDHPHIAKVLDGGQTAGGRPYFVMELVKGMPITQFCDDNRLTARQRLELFVPVCQAVQHAHHKGVIHRDLKPSNVLVTSHDGTPVVKVIDFGVAKAIGQQLTEKTVYTAFTQMVGTPLYMSPEQAGHSGLDVDTRSDVYSLGVLLYELLTGTTPFTAERLRQAGYDEIRRVIREEEPPKPSTRISTLGQAAATASAQRQSDPKQLSRLLRGEVDWVVMKCLEKDRNRRYETASALARDLQRYLHDEPVLACPPSAGYRLRKFVRRNKVPVLAAGLVLLVLVGGMVGTTLGLVQAMRARAGEARQRQTAEENLRKAHQAVQDYFTLVSEETLLDDPALEPLRNKLLQAALQYNEDFVRENAGDPGQQAELVAAYLRIGNINYLLGPDGDVLPPLQKALALLEDLMRKQPDAATLQALQAGTVRPVGARWYVRQPAEALRACEKARALWEELVREHPQVPGFQNDLAVWHACIGTLQMREGHWVEAAGAKQNACALWEKLREENPGAPRYQVPLATQLTDLSMILAHLGQLPAAEEAGQRGLALAKQLVAESPQVPTYRELLGWQYEGIGRSWEQTGRRPETEAAYRQAVAAYEQLVKDYPTVARYRVGVIEARLRLGEVLWDTGRPAEAAEVYRPIIALGDKLSPEDLACQDLFAWFLATCADPQFRDGRRAVEVAKKVVERQPREADYWLTLGAAHYARGDWQPALEALHKATRFSNARTSQIGFFLAMASWRLGDKDQSRKWYDEAVARMEQHQLRSVETRRLRAEAAQLLGVKGKRS